MERELDFYIKNEFLQLEDLQVLEESGYFDKLRLRLIGVRAFRKIALKIIEFLAQIENFQKKIWEKKKFVIDTHYVITLDKIKEYAGEEFLESILDEILSNGKQLEEWKELFGIEVKSKNDLIENNTLNGKEWKKLPIDTKYFDEEFKWKLLVALTKENDLDEILDGVLIKSENWQALNLLLKKYYEKVKTIYIDPPYNTGSDEFLYKDNYQHSSWLTMMESRLRLARALMRDDGIIFVSIDENEIQRLNQLMDNIYGSSNLEALVTWRRRHNQPNDPTKMIAKVSEHILVYSKNGSLLKQVKSFFGVPLSEKRKKEYRNPDNDPRGPWESKPWKAGSGQSGTRYKIISPTGKVFEEEWLGTEETFKKYLEQGIIYFPKGGDGLPRKNTIYMRGSKKVNLLITFGDMKNLVAIKRLQKSWKIYSV